MAGQWREWIVRSVLALSAPLLVVGSLEVAARALGLGYNPSFWIPVAGASAVATNDFFGLRFFPRALARTPAPGRVPTAKRPNMRRIFVLGESAAMGFPEPALGLAPMLEFMLLQAQPGVEWEVHNAAMTAINSHVILPIARECARLSPDVFIVLAGNNEVVGPFGPGTVFGQTGAPVWVARASIHATSMRFAQMLTSLLHRDAPREWRGLEMFSGRQLAFSDPRLARMYDTFRKNMIDIVRTGRQAGAEVLLLTVPVNVRDCPPFASVNPDNAANEFRVAHDLLASGKGEQALVDFRRARDFDALRFRADSRINNIIRETAHREDARLVDAEKSFGIAGNDLFWEHVHFTPAGTFRLASLIANELGVRNTPDFDQVRAALPVTSWDERNLRRQIAGMLRRAPFTAQAGNSRRITELQMDVDPSGLYADARLAFETAIELRPDDFHLLGRYASLLREMGDPQASADISARMMRLLPGRKAWHVSRGAALSEAGKHYAAIDEHKAALAIDPRFDLAHFGLGLAAARMGRHEQAVRHYEEALKFNPLYSEAAYNLAGSLTALGRTADAKRYLEQAVATRPDFGHAHAALAQLHAKDGLIEDAIRHYRQALEGDSALPEAHYDLGVLLARQGRLDEAMAQYQKAMQLRPDFPDALNNLGIALAKKGDSAGAAQAFERALKLQPSFEAARINLRRIRETGARR